MNYLISENIFNIITNMSSIVLSYTRYFMSLSLGIASILIMIVIAQEGFKLMTGSKSFDPLWWIRPILMLFIILTWQAGTGVVRGGSNTGWGGRYITIQGSLPGIINTTFGGLERRAKATFMSRMATLNERKKKKTELLRAKWDTLLNKGAEVEAAKEALKKQDEDDGLSLSDLSFDNLKESLSQSFESVKEGIVNYTKMILLELSHWTDMLFEWIGNFIWAVSIYATFMTQSLGLAFLTIFGPIHFGLSVFDVWKDAWASWLMKFISFHFYGWVAYIIMTASCSLIDFGIRSDIQLLSQPGFPEAFSFNALYTLFGYVVGALAMKMVPEIVSWMVPTNASQAAGAFQQGLTRSFGTQPASVAVRTGTNLAVAAVSSGAPYIGAAARGAASSVAAGASYGYRQFSNNPPSGSSSGSSNSSPSSKDSGSSSPSNKPSSGSSTK